MLEYIGRKLSFRRFSKLVPSCVNGTVESEPSEAYTKSELSDKFYTRTEPSDEAFSKIDITRFLKRSAWVLTV